MNKAVETLFKKLEKMGMWNNRNDIIRREKTGEMLPGKCKLSDSDRKKAR